jgi:hypothetical protein
MVTTPKQTHTRSDRDGALRLDKRAGRKLTPRLQPSELNASEHFVQFYETDAFLLVSARVLPVS